MGRLYGSGQERLNSKYSKVLIKRDGLELGVKDSLQYPPDASLCEKEMLVKS